MIKKIYVGEELHGEIMLFKIKCKAKRAEEVVKMAIEELKKRMKK